MYVPSSFAEPRRDVLFDFIEQHPLGALVMHADGALDAGHVPFLVDRARGPAGTLTAHLARANPQSRAPQGTACLVIFAGAQGYITPAWYATKAEHGNVVPTWDYVAVHATGTLRFIEDPVALRGHLGALASRFESARDEPWSIDDAPADFIERQMRAIVGIEIEVAHLEGKWKLSQNRSDADVDGVVAGLDALNHGGARELSRAVAAARPRRRS